MEEFRKGLNDLKPQTQRYYARYFQEFLTHIDASPQEFAEFVLKCHNSSDMKERNLLIHVWDDYSKFLQNGRDPPLAKTSLPNVKNAINVFIESNIGADARIKKKIKVGDYNGTNHITKDEIKEMISYQGGNLRNLAMIMVAKDTGLRVSDMAQLTVEDFRGARVVFDNHNREFRIWHNKVQTLKMGINAYVHMGPDAVTAVKRYIGIKQSGHIFVTNIKRTDYGTKAGDPMSSNGIANIFQTMCKPLRKQGKRVSAHSFRKFYFNSLVNIEKISKMIAGKKLAQTDSPYYEMTPELSQKYIENYHRLGMSNDSGPTREELEVLSTENKELKQTINKLTQMVVNLQADFEVMKDDAQAQNEMENSPEA
ncbi:MAG: tyrosine-type recombinase/integrase, partial [Candidatus Thorarchaeota archaeon]